MWRPEKKYNNAYKKSGMSTNKKDKNAYKKCGSSTNKKDNNAYKKCEPSRKKIIKTHTKSVNRPEFFL